MSNRPRMSFRDAMDLVPEELPDGAFFAMAHEIAGIEYGEGFAELNTERTFKCGRCPRRFASEAAVAQHRRDKHGETP